MKYLTEHLKACPASYLTYRFQIFKTKNRDMVRFEAGQCG